jgi:hypothetical protein
VATEKFSAPPRLPTTDPDPEDHALLLEAAKSALKWLEDFDEHAPDDWVFGGEGRVRRQLRQAIRRCA